MKNKNKEKRTENKEIQGKLKTKNKNDKKNAATFPIIALQTETNEKSQKYKYNNSLRWKNELPIMKRVNYGSTLRRQKPFHRVNYVNSSSKRSFP